MPNVYPPPINLERLEEKARKDLAGEGYDVIIVDSTDPVGPGEVLFTDSFYGHAKRRLNPGGVVTLFLCGDVMLGRRVGDRLAGVVFVDSSVPADGEFVSSWPDGGAAMRASLAENERPSTGVVLRKRVRPLSSGLSWVMK